MSNTGPSDATVIISYVEENDGFKLLEKELRPAIPFKGVKWTIKDGRPPEVCLDILPRFVPDDKVPKSTTGEYNISSAHQEPYLRIYVVCCEDADQYRSQIKPRMQKWMLPEAEHLIIHVSQKEPSFFSKNVFQLLRSDFGGPKSDRVIQLKLSGYEKSQQNLSFEEVVTRIRDCIAKSGQRFTEELQKRIRKLDGERMQKGWNFSTFFATKESLALVYESLAMYEDAYAQYPLFFRCSSLFFCPRVSPNVFRLIQSTYEELETLFMLGRYQFSCFGATEDGDDSGSVLNYNRKNYRSRLFDSSISEFDFRMYLFARQAHLLFRLGKPIAVAVRAMSFIENMLKVLSKNSLEPEFGWAWAFSAYIDVAESCRANSMLRQLSAAAKEKDSDPKIPTALNSMLGDLYFSSCQSLWKLGVSFSLIPQDTSFVFGPEPHEVLPQYSVGEELLAEKYDPYVPLIPPRESLGSILSIPSISSTQSLATVASFSPASISDVLEFNQTAGSDSPLKPNKHRRQPSIIESINLSDEVISSISLSDKTKRLRQSKTPARTGARSGMTHRRQYSADGALDLSSKLAAAAFVSEGHTPPSGVELQDSSPIEQSDERRANFFSPSLTDGVTQRTSTSPSISSSPSFLPDTETLSHPPGSITTNSANGEYRRLDEKESAYALSSSILIASKPPQILPTQVTPPSLRSTHPSLSTALTSPIGFDRVFLSVASKAKQSLRECGRERSVNRMTLAVAELHFIRGRYPDALECFKLCLNKFLIDNWVAEAAVLFPLECKIAECARTLALPDELTLALVLLMAGKQPTTSSPETSTYFMEELESTARFGLDESLMLSASPAFDAKVDVRAADAIIQLDRRAVVHVTITSNFILPITMDRVAVRFSSKSTQTRPARQIILESVDVEVSPGQNKIILSCNAPKGKFRLENCILQFGQVVFGQEYPQSNQQITVKASSVDAELDIAVPESMVFDNTQHVEVVIRANQQSMHGVVLRARSTSHESNLQLFRVPVERAWLSSSSGADMEPVAVECRNNEIIIPDLDSGQSVMVFLPCIFPLKSPFAVQDRSMSFVCHQGASAEVELVLEYRNVAREKKQIHKVFDLSFIHPVEAKIYSVPLGPPRKFLVCVSLRSQSAVPLQLQRYQLIPAAGDAHVTDLADQANIIGLVIRSKETMSLAFVTESAPGDAPFSLNLTFSLRDKQLSSLEKYGFHTGVDVSILLQLRLSSPLFAVTIEHDGKGEVGAPVLFRFRIQVPSSGIENSQSPPLFTLCFDESCWSYSGLTRGSVSVDSPPFSFCGSFVPLRSGSLPLPYIRLQLSTSMDSVDIDTSYSTEDFVACTPSKIFALLNQMEESFQVS